MTCQWAPCGTFFEAKTRRAKWCSIGCSVRGSKAGELGVATLAPEGAKAGQSASRDSGGRGGRVPSRSRRKPKAVRAELAKYTRQALVAAKRLDTWSGRAAVVLAARIDAGGAETGSALASMIKEHAAAMERALGGGEAADPVTSRQGEIARRDEVAQRRRERSSEG